MKSGLWDYFCKGFWDCRWNVSHVVVPKILLCLLPASAIGIHVPSPPNACTHPLLLSQDNIYIDPAYRQLSRERNITAAIKTRTVKKYEDTREDRVATLTSDKAVRQRGEGDNRVTVRETWLIFGLE